MKKATENEKVSIGYYKNKGTIEYNMYIVYSLFYTACNTTSYIINLG